MRRLTGILAVTIALAFALAGCDRTTAPTASTSTSTASTSAQTKARSAPQGTQSDLKITAVHEEGHHQFELSDDKIPSGWTTLEFHNETEVIHFAVLHYATPEFAAGMREDFGEISREGYLQSKGSNFQNAWDPYFNGEIPFGEFIGRLKAGAKDWYPTDRLSGGAGLLAGGETSRTTLHLKPGIYFVECAVLDEDGVFHVTNGMIEKLVVTEESSDTPEPKPTMRISLSADDGMEVADAQGTPGIRPGQHTVAVTFEDNETQGGHDLHLIRLDEGTTVQDVNDWMDLFDIGPDGFYQDNGAKMSTHDDPGPQTFLGGVQDIQPPLPETAYYHVRLTPGEYAWVSEIANPKARGFLKTFTVPFGQEGPQPAR